MADREPSVRNDAVVWSNFDAGKYWKSNYANLLPEDREIIEYSSKFLIDACGASARCRQGVDVGAGTNLYPGLLMLPWTEHIVFTEYASSNIDWLNQNLTGAPGKWDWQPFWDLIADLPCYRTIKDPQRELAAVREVRELSIFKLPERAWDLGSMFFVADGMTTDREEFEFAVRAFLNSLVPGSPFLMAFMEGSSGYDVDGVPFPSVTLSPLDLDKLLTALPVRDTSVLRTDKSVKQLREGYDAMLLVTGFVAA